MILLFDFLPTFAQAEDFLRRHIKPKAVQEAEKRRSGRKMREAGRRVKRAFVVSGASGAGLLGYGAAVAPVGTTAMIAAGAATLVVAGTAMLWPAQASGGGKISSTELLALAGNAEDWLLDQRKSLPGRALPAVDAVFVRFQDLQPRLAALDPHSTLAWELRRLLAEHLPRLIQSYAELPQVVQDEDRTLLPRLIEGLGTVERELARICKECSRDHLTTFEAQERFLATRYGDSRFGD